MTDTEGKQTIPQIYWSSITLSAFESYVKKNYIVPIFYVGEKVIDVTLGNKSEYERLEKDLKGVKTIAGYDLEIDYIAPCNCHRNS